MPETKRPLGRPRKLVSDARLVNRITVMFSDEDKARLEAMLQLTHAQSQGEVIREALRRDYERVTKQRT